MTPQRNHSSIILVQSDLGSPHTGGNLENQVWFMPERRAISEDFQHRLCECCRDFYPPVGLGGRSPPGLTFPVLSMPSWKHGEGLGRAGAPVGVSLCDSDTLAPALTLLILCAL